MTGSITADVDGRVCTVTIENEGKRNALDFSMAASVIETFEDLEARDEHAVVVMRGAGEKAFSSGFDLTIDRSDQTAEEKALWTGMMDAIESYPYPVIAMVNGDAYGGAVEVLAACDLRVGVADARFAVTPAKIGLVYGGRAIERVHRLVGPAVTRELLFTAEPLDAAAAADAGLLNHVYERGELEAEAYALAETIAGRAPFSLRSMKHIVQTIESKGALSDAEEAWVQSLRDEAFASDDHAEGVAAFREGRQPEFTGE